MTTVEKVGMPTASKNAKTDKDHGSPKHDQVGNSKHRQRYPNDKAILDSKSSMPGRLQSTDTIIIIKITRQKQCQLPVQTSTKQIGPKWKTSVINIATVTNIAAVINSELRYQTSPSITQPYGRPSLEHITLASRTNNIVHGKSSTEMMSNWNCEQQLIRRQLLKNRTTLLRMRSKRVKMKKEQAGRTS